MNSEGVAVFIHIAVYLFAAVLKIISGTQLLARLMVYNRINQSGNNRRLQIV